MNRKTQNEIKRGINDNFYTLITIAGLVIVLFGLMLIDGLMTLVE